ncbi:hypothetical protein AJ88_39920 [Mesorhizobium amorphae CCBAU 01583]|nr:hypothetical protein AJ88_39920 [Mesorhizobium amorphae CCBAU 01583]
MLWRRRSSGTKPMPARIDCAGLRGANGLPLRRTEPPSRRLRPKIASSVSERPAPTRPPRPTISPRCRLRETSRTSGALFKFSTSSTTGFSACSLGARSV